MTNSFTNRTIYQIEITAREKEAFERFFQGVEVVGDRALLAEVVRKIAELVRIGDIPHGETPRSVVECGVPEKHNPKHLLENLLHAVNEWKQSTERLMALFDNLVAAINQATGSDAAALTSAVDAAVTELGTLPPTDAQVAALTTQVQGLSTVLQAQTARLIAATTTTNPPPPTP